MSWGQRWYEEKADLRVTFRLQVVEEEMFQRRQLLESPAMFANSTFGLPQNAGDWWVW